MIRHLRALPALFLAAAAAAAGVGSGASGRSAATPGHSFGMVSLTEAKLVQTVIWSGDPAHAALVNALKGLDITSLHAREMLAPVNQALADIYARNGDETQALVKALETIDARLAAALIASKNAADPAAERSATAELLALSRFVELYRPESSPALNAAYADALQRRRQAAMLSAGRSADALVAGSASGQTGSARAAGEAPREDAPAAGDNTADLALTRGLIRQLIDSGDYDASAALRAQILQRAESSGSELLHREAASGLAKDLNDSSSTDYGQAALNTLVKLSAQSPFASVRLIAAKAAMKEAKNASDLDYSNAALNAARSIAISAPAGEDAVRAETIRLMLKEMDDASNSDYIQGIRARIDAIGESAGGLDKLQIPSRPVALPEISDSAAAPVAMASEKNSGDAVWMTGKQLNIGAKFLAALGAVLLAMAVLPGFHTSFLVFLGVTGWMTLASSDEPVAGDRLIDTVVYIAMMAAALALPFVAPAGHVIASLALLGAGYLMALIRSSGTSMPAAKKANMSLKFLAAIAAVPLAMAVLPNYQTSFLVFTTATGWMTLAASDEPLMGHRGLDTVVYLALLAASIALPFLAPASYVIGTYVVLALGYLFALVRSA